MPSRNLRVNGFTVSQEPAVERRLQMLTYKDNYKAVEHPFLVIPFS